ncbi:MAG: Spheroidene monooxygenase, partial [uncultured Cytophagales bacterium]
VPTPGYPAPIRANRHVLRFSLPAQKPFLGPVADGAGAKATALGARAHLCQADGQRPGQLRPDARLGPVRPAGGVGHGCRRRRLFRVRADGYLPPAGRRSVVGENAAAPHARPMGRRPTVRAARPGAPARLAGGRTHPGQHPAGGPGGLLAARAAGQPKPVPFGRLALLGGGGRKTPGAAGHRELLARRRGAGRVCLPAVGPQGDRAPHPGTEVVLGRVVCPLRAGCHRRHLRRQGPAGRVRTGRERRSPPRTGRL